MSGEVSWGWEEMRIDVGRGGGRCREGLPVTSPHGNFATVTSPHGNFATLSYIENLHRPHRNKTANSRLP